MTSRASWAWAGDPSDFDSGYVPPHVEYVPQPTPNAAPIAAGYASRDPARHPMRQTPQRAQTPDQQLQQLWYPNSGMKGPR